jgi:hypothetical protein
MKKYLQVRINNDWVFVFCRNELAALPITTKDKRKALPAKALDYFQKHYGSLDFRTV